MFFVEKSIYRGKLPKEGGALGQFPDLGGGLGKREGKFFWGGGFIPQCTLWKAQSERPLSLKEAIDKMDLLKRGIIWEE